MAMLRDSYFIFQRITCSTCTLSTTTFIFHLQLSSCVHIHYSSLVPRPSASRVRIAYVTFEPLSDSWQKAPEGLVPLLRHLHTSWTRFGTRFHVKWRRARSSRANGSELLLAFTLPWWTAGGVRYGTPYCTVVVA